jgi:glycosyltransferase involved in cell wall biosynthesis
MEHRVCIIIPVYNESKVLRQVISELKSYSYKNIIVVDDGSSDHSYNIAKKSGALVFRHRLNRGKGAAIKTGMEAAKSLNAEIVVTFDGDGQHDPKDIQKMIGYIEKGYDIVLGSRFLTLQNIPFYKRVANYFANIMTYVLYGIWVTDSQSGLRAYSKRALSFLDTKSDRYEFDTEVLRDIHRHHLRYKEIPIHVRYTAYSQQKKNRQDTASAILTAMKLIVSTK